MTENPCNCSTCNKKKDFSCKFGLADMTQGFTKVTGCFDHPDAREYLMEDAIEDLERNIKIYQSSCHDDEDRGTINGLQMAIRIIKEPVKK
jgi:hypothetical protein